MKHKSILLKNLPIQSSIFVLIVVLFSVIPVWLFAQPREIKRSISEIQSQKGTFYITATEKTTESARQKAKKLLIERVLGNFRQIDDIPTVGSADETLQESIVRKRVATLPFRAQEFTWGKEGKEISVFMYINDFDAKDYTVKRATARYRDTSAYSFAEGYAKEEKDALAYARGNLITQFSAKVSSETNITKSERTVDYNDVGLNVSKQTTLEKKENAKGIKEDYSNKTTLEEYDKKGTASVYQEEMEIKNRVFSQMTLQGLKTITIDLVDEYFAFAYISTDDKIKSFEVVKSKITASATSADRAFQAGNYISALRGFYKTFILSDTYFGNVEFTFTDGTQTDNLQQAMRAKIDAMLKDEVEVLIRPAYQIDERDIVAPFQMMYQGKPLNGLNYQFKYQNYNFFEPLKNGRGRINLPGYTPEYRLESFKLSFFIDISEDLKSDETLRELEPLKRFEVTKNIEVDFTNIFRFGVQAEFVGKRVEFTLTKIDPKLVREVRWELGNGEERYTSEPKLIYTYEQLGNYEVTVELNGEPKLLIKRFLDLSTKRIRVTEQLREIVAEVPEPTEEEIKTSAVQEIVVQQPSKEESAPKIEIKLNEWYREVSQIETTAALLSYLKARQEQHILTFGKQSDMLDSEGSMILVADQQKVFERLIFSQNRFYSITSGEEISSLSEQFRGKYLIWVKRNS